MRILAKLLILAAFGAGLSGCVVAPYGPPRAYVVAPAPVVVARPYYGPRYYYYGHYYYGPR